MQIKTIAGSLVEQAESDHLFYWIERLVTASSIE